MNQKKIAQLKSVCTSSPLATNVIRALLTIYERYAKNAKLFFATNTTKCSKNFFIILREIGISTNLLLNHYWVIDYNDQHPLEKEERLQHERIIWAYGEKHDPLAPRISKAVEEAEQSFRDFIEPLHAYDLCNCTTCVKRWLVLKLHKLRNKKV